MKGFFLCLMFFLMIKLSILLTQASLYPWASCHKIHATHVRVAAGAHRKLTLSYATQKCIGLWDCKAGRNLWLNMILIIITNLLILNEIYVSVVQSETSGVLLFYDINVAKPKCTSALNGTPDLRCTLVPSVAYKPLLCFHILSIPHCPW